MVRTGLALVCACLMVCSTLAAGQTITPQHAGQRSATPPRIQGAQFRVCADPENMPLSSRTLEGLENKLATLIAADFGTKPTYIWWGQRRGFIRNTMNATLAEGRCDIVMGVPAGYD